MKQVQQQRCNTDQMSIDRPDGRHLYDVAIVGASIGGCSSAILYAQKGLRVALIERNPDIDHYKKVCTHHIQPIGVPVLKKVGLYNRLMEAGGMPNSGRVWTRHGWYGPGQKSKSHGINIRRSVLDPMLRRAAAEMPNIDLLLGHSLRDLIYREDRVAGVEVQTPERTKRQIFAKLVVGADGRRSKTAELAGFPVREEENGRAVYFAYYRNMPLANGENTLVWFSEPDIAYAMTNEDGVTLLSVSVQKEDLQTFKRDLAANFFSRFQNLPNRPNIEAAEPISKVLGMLDMPNVARGPVQPGLALVGDAALASDPVWGNGMSWSLGAAHWLVDHTAKTLVCGLPEEVDAGLGAYREKHQARLLPRFEADVDFAQRRRFNLVERLMYAASVKDRRFWQYTGPTSMRWKDRANLPPAKAIFGALLVVSGVNAVIERASSVAQRRSLTIWPQSN